MSISSDMSRLTDALFDELGRLMVAGQGEGTPDLHDEIERAKSVQGLAAQMVATRRLTLDVAELSFRLNRAEGAPMLPEEVS